VGSFRGVYETATEGTSKGGPLRTYSAGVFLNGYSDHFPTEVFLVKPRK
ncbi:MAG: endonuclease/exonuclease/phosphatase family protein, partial [Muribaculaceae bacterium]|nr:endonuclease/exonuclease/phosphatase family protein [Muribaculaceae bacterium]